MLCQFVFQIKLNVSPLASVPSALEISIENRIPHENEIIVFTSTFRNAAAINHTN